MISYVRTCSQKEMRERRAEFLKLGCVIISIHSPLDPSLFHAESDRVLVLTFDDITPGPFLNDPGLYEHNRYFTAQQAERTISFVRKWEESDEQVSLLINCAAGISRSGAIATWALSHTTMKDHHFVEQNPHIMPNTWVLWKLIEFEHHGC